MFNKKLKDKIREKGFKGVLRSLKYRMSHYDNLIWYKYLFQFLSIKDNWILFQSEGDFADNARALYEYMWSHYPSKFKYIWVVEKPSDYEKRMNTVFVSSKAKVIIGQMYMWYFASRSKWLFFTHHGWYRVKRTGQTRFNLWHGIAIKGRKGSFDHADTFDFTTVTSSYFQKSQADFIGCSSEKVLSLGLPRNDLLFVKDNTHKVFSFLDISLDSKYIIWMPTFRSSHSDELDEKYFVSETGLPLLTTKSDLFELDRLMYKMKMKVVIKIHHLQAGLKMGSNTFENIRVVSNEMLLDASLQLYEIISHSTALLTDYSSVYIDYLLLNKPIGFILDDFDDYKKNRGFMFENVRELMPGHHIYNKNGLIEFFADISNCMDPYVTIRKVSLNKFYVNPDAASSSRVIEFLENNTAN